MPFATFLNRSCFTALRYLLPPLLAEAILIYLHHNVGALHPEGNVRELIPIDAPSSILGKLQAWPAYL